VSSTAGGTQKDRYHHTRGVRIHTSTPCLIASLQEAATNPDNLTEEQLRARLEEVAKTEFQKKDYSAQV
jgi:hypothetical protein